MNKNKIARKLGLGAVAGLVTGIVGGTIYRAFLPAVFYAQTEPSVTSVYYNSDFGYSMPSLITTSRSLSKITTIADNLFIRTEDAVYVARPVKHQKNFWRYFGNSSFTGNFRYGHDIRIVPAEEARPILAEHKKYLEKSAAENKFEVVSPLHASSEDMAVRSPNIVDSYIGKIKFYRFADEVYPRIEIYATENPLRVGQSAGGLAKRDLDALEALERRNGLKGPDEFAAFCQSNQVGYYKWPIIPFYWMVPATTVTFAMVGLAFGVFAAARERHGR